ncbi:unnamed protein product [Linum tenue]|uniref:non-specific serine/threonine protein kinase n=1 Tax=Linum tenue TaxID=586396 RepID=A0AAV0QM24_9ROSI|nr:unnamed protein product [Linum tenue]
MELLPLLQQFVLLFLLLCCSFSSVFPRSHELGILLEVKESLIAGGESLSDWNRSNPNFCKWSGVTCRSGRVVSGLNLSDSSLTGSIPPALGRLQNLLHLDLSSNALTGPIPTTLANLSVLIILDLSYNNLTGSIPPSIGKLSTLEALDLSHNQLQGRVPPQVGEIRSLGYFNVSFNRLEGDLGDRFQRWKADSFLGNSKLCGGPLDQCRRSANKHSSLSEAAIVVLSAITTLAALALLGLGLTFFCKRRREYLRARSDVSCIYSSSKSSHAHRRPLFLNPGSMKREFRWDDIMEATNHLGDEFVIGSGGSGTIYRAELRNGDTVAVKKVPWKDELMFNKSFAREVKTLGRIRHRHLVKLMGYCCNRGAGFNLLIYDYMENGSLWDWLHRQPGVNNKRKQCLDWEVRMQIALGLVRGVEYLHHDCVPIILHRDIKSSNVLLDSDMEAHLGDFGLAKSVVEFYDTTSTTESNSLFAGSYGYIAPGSLTLLSSLFPNFWVFFQLSV